MAAFLLHVRRRQVHRDSFDRQGQPEAGEGAAHSLTALGHGLVGEAHDHEGRQAPADMHLHIDRGSLDALEGDGFDMGNHAATPAGPTGTRRRPGALARVISHLV